MNANDDLRSGDLIILKPGTKLLYDSEEGCIATNLYSPVTAIVLSAYNCTVDTISGENFLFLHHEHALLIGSEVCYVESDQMFYDIMLSVQDEQQIR